MSKETFQKRITQLRTFLSEQGRLPSYSEMCELFKVKSKQAVARVVDKLIEHNLVEKDSAGRLIPKGIKGGARLVGTVQAGFPSAAEEELCDIMSLDDFLITNHVASFLLKVSGDSMIEAGIQPDDLVLLERGKQPSKGDIVVAEVDHEWTMKYYEKVGGKTVLKPANKNYPTIVPKEELVVAGVVTAVIRKYH
ncbi:MAG: repressor LexA [Parcubacteria group bacterium]|nr:repressor LexA [Parcubacteria group bacterium]|tara:strand:- start:213 stop:794 length:582 start_codon:yes stop_codon:yes gene_type:complete